MLEATSSCSPEKANASIVFSKVGSSGLLIRALISSSDC